MLTSIFLSLVALTAPAPEMPPEAPPMVGFVMTNCQSQEPDAKVLMMFAVYQNGVWSKPDLGATWGNGVLPEPSQEHFLNAYLPRIFHGAIDQDLTFSTTRISRFGIISCPYWGLAGTLKCGKYDPTSGDYMVSSQPPEANSVKLLKSGDLDKFDDLLAQARENILEEANGRSYMNYANQAQYSVDLERYATPELVDAYQFDLSPKRKGLWIHFKAPYPTDDMLDTEEPTGHYYAIFSVKKNGSRKILWEATYVKDPYTPGHYEFLGACDANGDGDAEILLHEGGHEQLSYYLYAMKGRKLVEVVRVGCSI